MASNVKLLLRLRNAVFQSAAIPKNIDVYRNLSTTSQRYFPICTVDTNLPKTDLPTGFAKEMCDEVAKILNKPIETVTVTVRPGSDMYRRGSDAPVLSVQIWSIGVFDAARNPTYTKALYKYLLATTKLPPERICVLFHPIERHAAGHLLYEEESTRNKIDLHK